MEFDAIKARAARDHLLVAGAFHPGPDDKAPEGCGTLVLLGPEGPGFWPHVTAEPEFVDGLADPVDRWSTRVVQSMADDLRAMAYFPFGGPPFTPFFTWAVSSGWAWSSPIMLLVQSQAGLMVSYRGALAFAERIELPEAPLRPCDSCAAPCTTACPVGALSGSGYDVAACHAYLDTPDGQDCMTQGCLARRACPVSQSFGRDPAQSAYHMGVFHR